MQSRIVFVVWMALGALAMRSAYGQQADALKKAQTAFDLAQRQFLDGKYDDAARSFQDAYDARPFPQFLYNVAATLHTKGKKESDPAAYQKAIDTYKRLYDSGGYSKAAVAYELASVYEANKQPDQAKDFYQKVVSEFPDSPFRTNADEALKRLGVTTPPPVVQKPS